MGQQETNGFKTIKLCILTSVSVAVIVAMWGLLINLVVLYHLQEAYEPPVNTNLQTGNSSNSSCLPDVYTGAVCRDTLQLHQQCLSNSFDDSEVYIPSDRDLQQLEQQVAMLIAHLQSLTPSPECSEAAIPLICLFYFGLCDSSGELQLPSATQCETVSNTTCAREFQLATAILGSDALPGCDNLPTTSGFTFCASNSSGGGLETTCQVDFFFDGGVCKPECGKWSIYSNEQVTATSALVFISTTVGIISGAAVLILALIRYKSMFKFPSIIVVYQTVVLTIGLVIFLIGRTDYKALYCNSDDLIDSYNNGSPFCTFSGAVYVYMFLQLVIWLLGHIITLFWGITFPFHYRAFERRGKLIYVHIAIVVLALILPTVSVGIAFGTGGYRYDGIPPLACLPQNLVVAFYAVFLPSTAIVATGGTFLVLIIWKLIKEHLIRKTKQSTTANAKVLLVTSYLFLINAYVIIIVSIRFKLWPGDRLMQELTSYFLCESTGLSTCDRTEIERYSSPQIQFNCFNILLGVFPVVNLLYAWNYRDIKRICRNSQRLNSPPLYQARNHHTTASLQKETTELEVI